MKRWHPSRRSRRSKQSRRAAASWLTLSLSPRRRQVNGGSPGDLRSGETSQGQGQGGMPSFQVVQRAISRCPLSLSPSLPLFFQHLTSASKGPPGPGEVSKEEAPAKSDGEDGRDQRQSLLRPLSGFDFSRAGHLLVEGIVQTSADFFV